jgi:predicted Fe-S protein YdhL (DUF1289 family)
MKNEPSLARQPASQPASTPAITPCTGVCRLDARGYCLGCLRSGEEIGRWAGMPGHERLRVMREVLPHRKTA